LRLLEWYDFTEHCIVNSFSLESGKSVAVASNHRVMISQVIGYEPGEKLSKETIDSIIKTSPNSTLVIFSVTFIEPDNLNLIKESMEEIKYAKSLGMVIGTTSESLHRHEYIKMGISLHHCFDDCAPVKVTPIPLCIMFTADGKVKTTSYGCYGSRYTADIEINKNKIILQKIRFVNSTREVSDGITPNLAELFPHSLSVIGDNVAGYRLLHQNTIEIQLDSDVKQLLDGNEKRIFVKFAYGV